MTREHGSARRLMSPRYDGAVACLTLSGLVTASFISLGLPNSLMSISLPNSLMSIGLPNCLMYISLYNRKPRSLITVSGIACLGAPRGSRILDVAVGTRTFFASAGFHLSPCLANSVLHVLRPNTVSQSLHVSLINFCNGIDKSIKVVEGTVGAVRIVVGAGHAMLGPSPKESLYRGV
jgi:hypothetical protein